MFLAIFVLGNITKMIRLQGYDPQTEKKKILVEKCMKVLN